MRQRINCKTIPPCKTIFEKVGYIYQILFNIRLIKKKTQSVFRIKPHIVDCVVRIEKNFCFGLIYSLFVFRLTNGYDACEKSNVRFEAAKYI